MNKKAWVGLTDEANEGEWRWLNGEIALSNQIAWEKGQPNDYKNSQNCALLRDADPFVNDVSCFLIISGLCKINEILHSGGYFVKGKFVEQC